MYRYNRRCTCDRCRAHILLWPVTMVTAGVLFLIQEFSSWRFEFDHTWPVLLIVIGLVMIAKRNASTNGHIDPAQEYVVLPATQPQQPHTEVHHG